MSTESTQERPLRSGWRNSALAVLSFASLGIIVYVEFAELPFRGREFRILAAVDLGIVLVLATDLAISFLRAESRARWLKSHWYEILGLVPLYAEGLSFFRIFQLARLARVMRLLRAASAFRYARPSVRFLDALFNRGKLGHALYLAAMIVLAMAVVVWLLERDHNPGMRTFGEALWWAIVTATTVGYGDITPRGGLARLFSTGLMLVGIGMVGVVASSMSTALLKTEGETVAPGTSLVDALERLALLRERGALNEDEFTAAKRQLLG